MEPRISRDQSHIVCSLKLGCDVTAAVAQLSPRGVVLAAEEQPSLVSELAAQVMVATQRKSWSFLFSLLSQA